MAVVKFTRGDLTEENIQKIYEKQGAQCNVYIDDEGMIYFLKEKEGFQNLFQKVRVDVPKTDLKNPLEYDLEGRIREVNGETEVDLEEVQYLIEKYGREEAIRILRDRYPFGYKIQGSETPVRGSWYQRASEGEEKWTIKFD